MKVLLLLLPITMLAQEPVFDRNHNLLPDYSTPRPQVVQQAWTEDFRSKANKFVEIWAKFAAAPTFDVKLAKKLDKAFSDMKKSAGWPKE